MGLVVRCVFLLVLSVPLARSSVVWAQDTRPEGTLTEGQIVREQWTIQDGLPVNHANALLQDTDGYLWLATFDGLVRFDGVRFTVFNAGNTPGLPSSRFPNLTRGTGGTFWAENEQGDLLVDGRHHMRFWRGHGIVSSALGDGTAWLASHSGLYRQTRDTLQSISPDVFGGRYVTRVLRTRTGDLWAAAQTERGNSDVWRYTKGRWVRVPYPLSALVYVRFADAGGTVWVGGHGLARFDGRAIVALPMFAPGRRITPDTPDSTPFNFEYVSEVEDAEDGGVIVSTFWGLYWTDGTAVRLLATTPHPDRLVYERFRGTAFATCPDRHQWTTFGGQFLRDGRVAFSAPLTATDFLCDREGNLWVTTSGEGLHRFREPLVRTVSEAEGLAFRNVAGVFEDRTGGLWVGTNAREFARLYEGRLTSGQIPAGSTPTQSSPGSAGVGLEAGDGTLWVGRSRCLPADRTPDGGCARFTYLNDLDESSAWLRAILEARDGTMWFGLDNGLARFDGERWTRYAAGSSSGGGLPDRPVRFLLEARDGTLWLATNGGGIARFVPETDGGRFEAVTAADGLPSDNVRWLHEGDDGALWVVTEDRGLARLDPVSGDVAVVRAADGLYDDGLHSLLDDGRGRFWFSTNRGLFWVLQTDLDAFVRGDADRVASVAYTERDGMRNREANGGFQTSALRARDGRLWFATQDGVVVVDPAEVGERGSGPPLVIEGVRTRGSSVPAGTDGSVRLGATERDFTVAYTALSFAAPDRVRFRYRLDGFSDRWVEAEGGREAVFTNVPPGRYTFRVVASNGDGAWTEEAAALAVSVAPFFWETWWFRVLGLLALAGAFTGGVRWRTRQARLREAELEAQVAQRTTTIEAQRQELATLDEAKSRFFANVSHEFRTPLTLTLGPLEDLQSEAHGSLSPAAHESVDLALRNSRRLLHLVNQLLDVAKLEAGELTLDRSPLDLGPWLASLALAFTPLAERRRTAFTVETPDEPVVVSADPDALEGVVANLLSNAFKFTPAGGSVALSLVAEGGVARLAVADTGPGVPADALPHLFERFYRVDESASDVQAGTGIGLALARDLVDLHGGTIDVESTQGVGSRFVVALPLTDEAAAPTPPVPARAVAYSVERAEAPGPDDVGDPDRTTVLVVDDNADVRRYVRSHLEATYRVVEAADGQEGVEVARERLPDCVVSDVMMPRLDGFGLVRALRADPATDFLPVILLTAKATEADKLGGLGEGADDYLVKPFNVRELQARVENLIRQRQRLRLRFSGDGPPGGGGPSTVPVEPAPTLGADEAAFLDEVRAVIEANLADEAFSVDALADAVAQSRSTLHRRLKAVAGTTPQAFIQEMRLARAAALLSERAGTVSEVAYGVGFKSVSHFSRAFGARYGVPPSGWIERAAETRASRP